jgi:hypothetical protein
MTARTAMDGVMSKLDVRPLPAPQDGLVRHHRLALPVILAGTFMVVLDFFIVNVAIPSIQRELHTGTAAIEWWSPATVLRTPRC